MIELTRLNGNVMVMNSDLIKTVESSPDTMLTLITGEKLIVREQTAEVAERVLAYRARLLASVGRNLSSLQIVQRVSGITSLDVQSLQSSDALCPQEAADEGNDRERGLGRVHDGETAEKDIRKKC